MTALPRGARRAHDFDDVTDLLNRSYDPEMAPDPDEWMALDEGERIDIVSVYHESNGIDLPDLRLHSAMHVVVENQLSGEKPSPVPAVLLRLMNEGLSRHDAIHAIASVVSEQMFDLLNEKRKLKHDDEYYDRLKSLSAESWRNS